MHQQQFKSGCCSEMKNVKFSYKMNCALCGCSTAGKGHVHHMHYYDHCAMHAHAKLLFIWGSYQILLHILMNYS